MFQPSGQGMHLILQNRISTACYWAWLGVLCVIWKFSHHAQGSVLSDQQWERIKRKVDLEKVFN